MGVQVWSCGGGVQSAAIGALIVQGRLPKPDLACIVDTNREKSATWRYFDEVLSPELLAVDVQIVRVDRSQYATVDLLSTNGENLLIPAYTDQSGQQGQLGNFCSGEWKRRIIERWLRAQGIKTATSWMGMSTNELHRVKVSRSWLQKRYPLVFEVPMSRQDCIGLVQQMGWPDAPRSSCWMCPYMSDAQWREMKETDPLDFAEAVKLERQMRKRDPNVYLHGSLVPLDSVDFTNYQMSFTGCDSGYCFT